MSLLTVREVAEELRISQMTVRRHIASGKLRAVRVGRGVRIDRSAVDRFVTPVDSGMEESEPAGQPLSFDDPIWQLVGMIKDDGPTDMYVNHDRYLADAYADTHDR